MYKNDFFFSKVPSTIRGYYYYSQFRLREVKVDDTILFSVLHFLPFARSFCLDQSCARARPI